MKKTDLMKANSRTRLAVESSNASLRNTANVFDFDQRQTRPATEEERRVSLMRAWVYAAHASKLAGDAATLAQAFCLQNGITASDLDAYVSEVANGK